MNRKDIDRRKKFILELMGDPVYKPMRLRELSSLLRLSREEKRELFDVLDSLCEDGKITQDNKGRYSRITGKWKKKEKQKLSTSIRDMTAIRVRLKFRSLF